MTEALLVYFPESAPQAKALANALQINHAEIGLHQFPDGESKITAPPQLASQVIIYRSLNNPNSKLIELIILAETLRNKGVKSITLVAPYLSYMRQDIEFHAGEAVSQQIIGRLLANYLDNVITVDSHLHRISQLNQAIPVKNAINITATQVMAEFIGALDHPVVLIGPDAESEQWVAAIALQANTDYLIANKVRHGDRDVTISLPEANLANKHIVLVDDVASTGKTLLGVCEKLSSMNVASISVLVTHALFVDNAETELRQRGVTNIWSCNSVTHPTNRLDLTETLAQQLRKIFDKV
jgi:ribose-phosphate pyrophosphokinase